jgi:hypothetical protein
MTCIKDGVNQCSRLLLKISLKTSSCQLPMAHTSNPSYSGGRDQEDGSTKPA